MSQVRGQEQKEEVKQARASSIRFLLLFLVIIVAFVNEYSFNNPQALEDSMEQVLDISQADFQLFYSLYALPNIFTLLFIGYLSDLFGVRRSLMLLSGLIALFQLLIAIGGYAKSYETILVGRILFGIVSEAVFIPQASIISFWFRGKQQAFALGIAITFPELGNALNSYLTPIIYEHTQVLGDPLMFSFGLCVLGLLCAFSAAYLDLRADRLDAQNGVELISATAQDDEEIRFSDVTRLSRSYWIIACICTAAMSLWIPFLDNVNRLFQKRFCYNQVSAGKVITVVYLTTTATSIPLGLFVDKYGNRRALTILGLLVFLTAQILILAWPQCDGQVASGAVIGLYFEGLGYSFYANVMVASIPLVVRMKLLGTAFGIMQMLQSFFEFVVPLATGFIVSGSESPQIGYRYSSALFVILGICGLGLGTTLYCVISEHHKHKLDRSSDQNQQVIARRLIDPTLVSASSTSSVDTLPLGNPAKQESTNIAVSFENDKSLDKPLLAPFQFQL